LPEADCHRKMKDYDLALECYHNILGQDIGCESYPGEIHANALASQFAIWNEVGDNAAMLSFLRELKDNTKAGKGLSYWLGSIIGSSDTLQEHLIKAAKQLGAIEEISQLYREVTEPKALGQDTGAEPPQAVNTNIKSLRFFQATLRFHGSHHEALEIWEELISKPDDTWNDYWLAYRTFRVLARALLDRGAGESSGQSGATSPSSYMSRLKSLCNSNQPIIRGSRQSVHDPHICLIRLHLLNGDKTLADKDARRLLRAVFDQWPTDSNDESLLRRFGVLAQNLTVYGLEEDAVAAWQALKPRNSTDKAVADELESPAPLAAGEEEGSDHSSATDASSATLQAPSPPETKREAYVSHYSCDSCNLCWTHMLIDCWACRNCLCVQLCTPCHKTLLDDDMDPLVCNKQHEFLYLPKFDAEQWSSMPDGMILVGGNLVAQEQWLDHIRERWDVQQEQIDAYKLETARRMKATICIARFVRRCQGKRMKGLKVTRRAHTFPLLQR
jgi:tetratricopeptide (TPR) repeat protein